MSYDVYITPGVHPDCKADHQAEWRDITSNVAPVWREAGIDIAECDGKKAGEFIEPLREAIKKIREDPEHYRQYVRGGGSWGTLEGALEFLEWIEERAAKDLEAVLTVSY